MKAMTEGQCKYQGGKDSSPGLTTEHLKGEAVGHQMGWLYGPRYLTSLVGTPCCLGIAEAADHKSCNSVEEVSEGKRG